MLFLRVITDNVVSFFTKGYVGNLLVLNNSKAVKRYLHKFLYIQEATYCPIGAAYLDLWMHKTKIQDFISRRFYNTVELKTHRVEIKT